MALQKSSPNTEIQRIAYHDMRYYRIDRENSSEYYPSVTTILGAVNTSFLARWRGDVGNDVADGIISKALSKGSRIHYALERFIEGDTVICNPNAGGYFNSDEIVTMSENGKLVELNYQDEYIEFLRAKEFLDVVSPSKIVPEQTLYSVVHKFAGTGDILMYIKKGDTFDVNGAKPLTLERGWYIGDLKTGKTVSSTTKYQLSAYAVAVKEMYDIEVNGSFVLHSNSKTKKGIEGLSVPFWNREETFSNFEDFKVIHKMYLISNPIPKPKLIEFPKSAKLSNKIERVFI